jgi:hypothetical protein
MKSSSRAETNSPTVAALTRRGALGRLAGLLALGAWPGAVAQAKDAGPAAAAGPGTRFVVLNDFHHDDANCDPWMEALFRQVAQTEGAAFCFLLGDLANKGKRESLVTMRRLAGLLEMPFYVTPGNHDLDESPVGGFYSEIFPERLNYTFTQGGWQFVVVDTSDGNKSKDVVISTETLAWLDRTLPTLDPKLPTVVGTHFPLAASVRMCPLNAENLLARFVGFNLRATFSGHFHGQTEHDQGQLKMTTNVCVARVRGNHDGTDFKGYWVCDARPDGSLTREFVPFVGPDVPG